MVVSERLELVPCPLDLVQSLAAGRRDVPAGLAVSIPQEWPTADLRDFLPIYAGILSADPGQARWGVWLMIRREGRLLVGDIGFKGSPDQYGHVEIGYGVLPTFQRQGYGFEAASAVVDWALTQPGVQAVTAECLTENAGSVRILEKLGMARTGAEGPMLRWMLKR